MTGLTGIHHVTALARDPRRNRGFYTEVLGAHLVKRTVNFDDPLTYHLYYGDPSGAPGTLLTHFPHPLSQHGSHGVPEILQTVLSVPEGALEFWTNRLAGLGIETRAETVLGDTQLAFADPDDMRLALVEADGAPGRYDGEGMSARYAIGGVEGVVIHVEQAPPTVEFLETVLGFTMTASEGARHRLHCGPPGGSGWLEVVEDSEAGASRMGAGIVHHVAWRVPDDDAQRGVAERLRSADVGVTPVRDRQYFRSIYFRIPGDVIFEVATDGPGFDVDEPAGALGRSLKLPPRLEPRRAQIEAHLPPLDRDRELEQA